MAKTGRNKRTAKSQASIQRLNNHGVRTGGQSGDAGVGAVLVACVVAILVTAAVHAPAVSSKAFALDDHEYVITNPLVQHPGWTSAGRFLTEVLDPSTVRGYYQPLTMISLMVDRTATADPNDTRPYRRTSLWLHALNAGLVCALVACCFGNVWAALISGLLFGLHPQTVESVVSIAQRKTLLATFFALWSLILYVRFAMHGRRGVYVLSIVAFVLSLLAKPTTVPLPLLMIVLDWWPLRRISWKAVREKIPFFIVMALAAIVTIISQSRTAGIGQDRAPNELAGLLAACYNLMLYVGKLFWPMGLSAYYAAPSPLALSNPLVIAGLAGTIVLSVAVIASLKFTRSIAACGLFFVIGLGPVIGIVTFTTAVAADRFVYLPMIGIVLAIAGALSAMLQNARLDPRRSNAARAAFVASLAAACALAFATRSYLPKWRDSDALYQHMMAGAPDAPVPCAQYGYLLAYDGRFDEAIEVDRRAVELAPDWTEARFNLATALQRASRTDEAVEQFHRIVQVNPQMAEAHVALGRLNLEAGAVDAAHASAEKALESKPTSTDALLLLADVLQAQGKPNEAIDAYNAVLRARPWSVEAMVNLGAVLAQTGRQTEAVILFQRALEQKPNSPAIERNLAKAQLALGQTDQALARYKRAVEADPTSAEARGAYGSLLARMGELSEAQTQLRESIRLDPGSAPVHNDLALTLARQNRFEEAEAEYREAIRLDPNLGEAHNNLGQTLFKQRRFAAARDEYVKALEIDPESVNALVNIAVAHGVLGRTDLAIASLRKAIDLDPDRIDARIALGQVLERFGDPEEARAQFQEALRIDPANAAAGDALRRLDGADSAPR